ncbi:hypothetical protein L486_01690 [Kwoniella mangroviensis CBS 10435]|uniref:Fe2OG dioxygenase domain-containing protein n=1 Tax=Kwoniella mangroviensis CBS 10435 TaxID=1331196 RepID=A0A1B9J2Y6_9TREE|nr:hypothetical protein L486_01690 [Kwoniella mangroviensis CBS 10435]
MSIIDPQPQAPSAVTTKNLYEPYSTTPETTESQLVNLDLSTFDLPGGKEALAKQFKYAVHNVGFFYVSNFGLSQEEVDYQFSIGKQIFDLPLSEKVKYGVDTKAFSYNGYTGPANHQIDISYVLSNIPKLTSHFPDKEAHPRPVQDNWDTIEHFAKTIHRNVIERLLVIFALVLELADEEYFVKRHNYETRGEDHLRYMPYTARDKDVNKKAQELYSTELDIDQCYAAGHTDLGSITLLFRQPVAGLQVLNNDGKYRWVRPVKGTITVNIADTLSLLSGRYFKSSIHRVSVPPADQRHLGRLGVLFFIRPNNDVLVEVVKDSPLLKREGVYEPLEERKDPLDVGTWVKERQKHIFKNVYDITDAGQGKDGQERDELEAEVAGIKIKYWN